MSTSGRITEAEYLVRGRAAAYRSEYVAGQVRAMNGASRAHDLITLTSTESYDRGEKYAYYRQLDSLREYVLIAQDRVRVEHHARDRDWRRRRSTRRLTPWSCPPSAASCA